MSNRLTAAALLALTLPGCWSRPAVVFSLPSQDAASRVLAEALHARGYDVLRKSTDIPRARTSIAVYDVRRHMERVRDMAGLMDELGWPRDAVLPFQQHATGGNAVVAWLGADVK
jgi:hypothetical protein